MFVNHTSDKGLVFISHKELLRLAQLHLSVCHSPGGPSTPSLPRPPVLLPAAGPMPARALPPAPSWHPALPPAVWIFPFFLLTPEQSDSGPWRQRGVSRGSRSATLGSLAKLGLCGSFCIHGPRSVGHTEMVQTSPNRCRFPHRDQAGSRQPAA